MRRSRWLLVMLIAGCAQVAGPTTTIPPTTTAPPFSNGSNSVITRPYEEVLLLNFTGQIVVVGEITRVDPQRWNTNSGKTWDQDEDGYLTNPEATSKGLGAVPEVYQIVEIKIDRVLDGKVDTGQVELLVAPLGALVVPDGVVGSRVIVMAASHDLVFKDGHIEPVLSTGTVYSYLEIAPNVAIPWEHWGMLGWTLDERIDIALGKLPIVEPTYGLAPFDDVVRRAEDPAATPTEQRLGYDEVREVIEGNG
jgi:hypothetical protein